MNVSSDCKTPIPINMNSEQSRQQYSYCKPRDNVQDLAGLLAFGHANAAASKNGGPCPCRRSGIPTIHLRSYPSSALLAHSITQSICLNSSPRTQIYIGQKSFIHPHIKHPRNGLLQPRKELHTFPHKPRFLCYVIHNRWLSYVR